MRTALVIAGLTVAFLANVVPFALSKPFWHDEIYTILLSRLPSFADTWNASVEGVDLSPPLNLWLTRAVHLVAPVGPLTTRMPALAGFYVAMLLVFGVLRRRAGTATAVTGSLLLLFTAGLRYAAEARAYGVMIGLAALALYAWMEAAAGRRRAIHVPLLFVALAASLWNHYFGILMFAPIAAGEIARIVRHRTVDAAIGAAVLLAMASAIPLTVLVQTAAAHRATYWARPPALSFMLESYRFLLAPLLEPTFFAVALVVIVSAIVRVGEPKPERSVSSPEATALIVAALIPVWAVALGWAAGIPVVPRYFLTAVPALCIALPLTIWRANRRHTGVELAACTCLVMLVIAGPLARDRPRSQGPLAQRVLFLDSLRAPSPTVVSGTIEFLQFWYYAPPDLKSRMRYLADPTAARERSGSDTIDRGYLALARWTPLPVERFADFVQTNRSFRIYETESGSLTSRLEKRAAIEEIGREPGGWLYQVTMGR
jgi:hypothetical protein